jgi:hypothetical protein
MGTGYCYPFSLNTTTAGISAKARSIGIINVLGVTILKVTGYDWEYSN